MTDTSQTRLALVPESTWGVTPTTPSFITTRMTGEGLTPNIENVVSNEIRADRNIGDLAQVSQSAGGTYDFELSYGAFDDVLESAMFSTWSTDVLINGVTQKSFTIEKTFETGATDQYHRFAGAVCNGFTLSTTIGAIVTGTFDFMAKGISTGQAIITDATYTDTAANDVINSATGFANLTIAGVTNPEITALNIAVTNKMYAQNYCGSLDARALGTGRFEVTGDLEIYFENSELFDIFLAGQSADLSFKLGGASSKNYLFEIDNLKFATAEIISGGNDEAVMGKFTFQGLYDGIDNTLRITRTA